MSRKKHVLMAAGAALSLGLCVGVSGCAPPTSPDPGSTEQEQPAKAEAPYIEEFEVNYDLRWYCFDSTLVIVAKNGRNSVAIDHIPESPLCAK